MKEDNIYGPGKNDYGRKKSMVNTEKGVFMPIIKVKDGMGDAGVTETEGEYGIMEFIATDELPAFLPDGSVCPDGEYDGEVVMQFYTINNRWLNCTDKHGDIAAALDYKTRKSYCCINKQVIAPNIQSPAEKYIAALEKLKKPIPAAIIYYYNGFNDAIDECIKTIRDL